MQRYIDTIRADAPNAEGGTNVDYVVRYNGFADREALYEAVLATEQWVGFIGFFPGLPFMFSLDPRETVFVPKYNPSRTWTAEGAVGLGGPCYSIYPSSRRAATSCSAERCRCTTLPAETRSSVTIRFCSGPRPRPLPPVEEDELLALFEDVKADRYRYDRQDGVFDVAEYAEWLSTVRDELTRPVRGRGGGRGDTRAVIEILEPGIQTTVQDYPGRRGLLAKASSRQGRWITSRFARRT